MSMFPRHLGAEVKSFGCGAATATAAGTGDNTAVTGASIDRTGYSSGVLAIGYRTTLASTKTLSLAAELQESADGTTWDTAEALQAATVQETGAATNKAGVKEFDIDLTGRKKFIRFNFTPDLSATAADTVDVAAIFVAGGADIKPA